MLNVPDLPSDKISSRSLVGLLNPNELSGVLPPTMVRLLFRTFSVYMGGRTSSRGCFLCSSESDSEIVGIDLGFIVTVGWKRKLPTLMIKQTNYKLSEYLPIFVVRDFHRKMLFPVREDICTSEGRRGQSPQYTPKWSFRLYPLGIVGFICSKSFVLGEHFEPFSPVGYQSMKGRYLRGYLQLKKSVVTFAPNFSTAPCSVPVRFYVYHIRFGINNRQFNYKTI